MTEQRAKDVGPRARRLVVVPSDPISAYEDAGYERLEEYFNPGGLFREVYALSPREHGIRMAHGMTIRGVPPHQFVEVLKELDPDVLRAYGGYWPADLVCRRRSWGIPVVVSVHDPSSDLVHGSIRYADLVICVSDAVARVALARGTAAERIRIVPNRVDRNVFTPIHHAGHGHLDARFPNGKHILHVGRKHPAKNIDTLVAALALLPNTYSCVFIGRGDVRPYATLAQQHGVDGRCFWIDAVKNSDLPTWYSWCDCMCTPSRWEGFGTVFIEAAACGAPIVTSDIAPMNEYLTHDVSASLVKQYQQADALATAIRRVCEDGSYRKRISEGARLAAVRFDRDTVDLTEIAVYREAMRLPRPSWRRSLEISAWHGRDWMRSRLPRRVLRLVDERRRAARDATVRTC